MTEWSLHTIFGTIRKYILLRHTCFGYVCVCVLLGAVWLHFFFIF